MNIIMQTVLSSMSGIINLKMIKLQYHLTYSIFIKEHQ